MRSFFLCGLTLCLNLTPSISVLRADPPETPAVAPAMPKKKLGIGDAAPSLKVGKWIQGEALAELPKDQVTVVEFWATWCGPCRATIPHLTELHNELSGKGVTFVGQNCFENEPETVAKFVAEMGPKMAYRVSLDDFSEEESGAMAKNWMSAAGQNGIPCAFVVGKDGKIAWIGHPAKLTAAMLTSVVEGKFDVEAAAAEKNAPSEDNTPNFGALHSAVGTALQKGQWQEAAEALKKLKEAMPKDELAMLALLDLQVALGQQNHQEAVRCTEELQARHTENVVVLQNAAWIIASISKDNELLAKAWDMSEKALAKVPDPGKPKLQHIRSRILYQQGKVAEAKALLEAALPTASERLKPLMEEALKVYNETKSAN